MSSRTLQELGTSRSTSHIHAHTHRKALGIYTMVHLSLCWDPGHLVKGLYKQKRFQSILQLVDTLPNRSPVEKHKLLDLSSAAATCQSGGLYAAYTLQRLHLSLHAVPLP